MKNEMIIVSEFQHLILIVGYEKALEIKTKKNLIKEMKDEQ